MFDAHPPFRIDGNFGFTAGVAEMLMQSHNGYVHLLPALPSMWPSGEVKGLVARGGFVIDIKWSKGRIQKLIVHSRLGGTCRIKVPEEMTCRKRNLFNPSRKNSSPLLKQSAPVPFADSSKTDPVVLHLASSKTYEWATEARRTCHLEVKK